MDLISPSTSPKLTSNAPFSDGAFSFFGSDPFRLCVELLDRSQLPIDWKWVLKSAYALLFWKSVKLDIFFLVIAFSTTLAADVVETGTCFGFCFGSKRNSVGYSSGTTISTEGTANQIKVKQAEGKLEVNMNIPDGSNVLLPTPNQGIVIRSNNKLVGSLTAIDQANQIFITAVHVLQDVPKADLASAFASHRLEFSKFRIFEFKGQDAALVIPFSLISSVVTVGSDGQMYLSTDKSSIAIASDSDSFFTSEYGYTAAGQESLGVRTGVIAGLTQGEDFRILLPESAGNPGSSGSVVLLKGNNDAKWTLGGVIECKQKPGTIKGLQIPSYVRVIPFSILRETPIQIISLEQVNSLDRTPDARCIKVDGRDGGGR